MMRTSPGDRLIAGAGAALMVGLLGAALLLGLRSGGVLTTAPEPTLLSLTLPPPRPPAPREVPRRARHAAAAAAPRALRARATPVVAPPPVLPRLPPPIVAAPVAGSGAAPRSGASDLPGPGTGAGGVGDGTGAGGDGDGDGGGGIGPEQVGGRLKFSDLPEELRGTFTGGTVGVRYRVEVNGRVSRCLVTHGSGTPLLDAQTCRLIQQRFRFRPARDEQDRPVAADIVENHTWDIQRDPDRDER